MALAMQAAPSDLIQLESESLKFESDSAWPLPNQLGLSKDFSVKSQTQSQRQSFLRISLLPSYLLH